MHFWDWGQEEEKKIPPFNFLIYIYHRHPQVNAKKAILHYLYCLKVDCFLWTSHSWGGDGVRIQSPCLPLWEEVTPLPSNCLPLTLLCEVFFSERVEFLVSYLCQGNACQKSIIKFSKRNLKRSSKTDPGSERIVGQSLSGFSDLKHKLSVKTGVLKQKCLVWDIKKIFGYRLNFSSFVTDPLMT